MVGVKNQWDRADSQGGKGVESKAFVSPYSEIGPHISGQEFK